jgi:hypothetical protein
MDAAWPTADLAAPASAAAVAPGGRQLLNLLSSEDSNWRVASAFAQSCRLTPITAGF